MTESNRTRGVLVYPLAPEAYDVRTLDNYALGVNPNTGETYLIHSEGVSYIVTHDKPWRFNDYSLEAKFHTLMQVREMPVKAGIDLADWIRSFGHRLESNFRIAYRSLTTTEPRADHGIKYDPDVYALLCGVGPVETPGSVNPAETTGASHP